MQLSLSSIVENHTQKSLDVCLFILQFEKVAIQLLFGVFFWLEFNCRFNFSSSIARVTVFETRT